jgi:hypothetical protein
VFDADAGFRSGQSIACRRSGCSARPGVSARTLTTLRDLRSRHELSAIGVPSISTAKRPRRSMRVRLLTHPSLDPRPPKVKRTLHVGGS